MKTEIRDASARDAGIISVIHTKSWKSAYKGIMPQDYLDGLREDFWEDAMRCWLKDGLVNAGLFYEDGRPVGCVTFGAARYGDYPDCGEIISLYLLPECTHRGYGGALVRVALARLKQAGYKTCIVLTLRENVRARRFYEKCGFVPDGQYVDCEVGGQPFVDMQYMRRLSADG